MAEGGSESGGEGEEWVEAEIERLLVNTNVDDADEDNKLDLGKQSHYSDCQEVLVVCDVGYANCTFVTIIHIV